MRSITLFLFICLFFSHVKASHSMNDWSPGIGGCGGVFFQVSLGQLNIEVEKRDRNLRQHETKLRAILLGPDRQVLQEAVILDDGLEKGSGTGPALSTQLSVLIDRPGIYAMMIVVTNDRYGEDVIWRFRTNCSKYLIETSRGHRDADHEEPIVLLDPERKANVCFLPPSNSFNIQVTELPEGMEPLLLKDATGENIATLPVKNGKVDHTVDAGNRNVTPWQLCLLKAQAKVHIDGTTRWPQNQSFPNLSLWTFNADSWFDLHPFRWLLTPYNQTIYGQPGEKKSITFQVHNNGLKSTTVNLSLEFPQKTWEVMLSDKQLRLAPKEKKTITLSWATPGENRMVHLRASIDDYTTYATLKTKVGESPALQPLKIPLVLKPFQHENQQFGYMPDYPVENQVYFNPENQPFIRTSKGIASHSNEGWETATYPQPVSSAISGAWTKIAFDKDGDLYMLALEGDKPMLMHSKDNGRTFFSYKLPDSESRSFDIEQFSGHNIPNGPPPITRYTHKKSDERHFWRRYGDLELLIPKKTTNGIEWEKPIFISDKSLGVSLHSGIPSSIVSRGSKVHVAWGVATDPDIDVPGVPAYVVTYDRETKHLSKPSLIGYGAPANDIHNTPCITMDSQGYIHILTGTHGRAFHYARSLKPNDIQSGWTEPEPVGQDLRQTYIGLVTGPDNTLHLVFRLWKYHTEYFPESHFAALAYMSKKQGEPWSKPRTLVVAPLSEYSIYYHRLTIDHTGRLFLSYDYWSTLWFYRTDHLGRRRALMMSPDGGETWKLATSRDMVP